MTVAVLAVAVALLVGLPFAVDRWAAPRASPASLATLAMVSLAGLVLAPLAVAACLAELVGHRNALGPPPLSLPMALGALTVGRVLLATWRAEGEWRRIASASATAAVAGPPGVTVVPLETPTAFVAGDRIVVSTALVDALDPAELEAVIAHEAAHIRGGHPRIVAWAHALCGAIFHVPPARAAAARVRHQLELLADRHAVDTIRDPEPIRVAMTKLAADLPTSGFERRDAGQLTRERLDCLVVAPPAAGGADRLVAIATGAVAVVIVLVVCGALHARLLSLGIAMCGLAGAGLWSLLRPLHRQPRTNP